jgi:hypothetical protein
MFCGILYIVMHSILFDKFKESSASVAPIIFIVLALHFVLAPLGEDFFPFLVGAVLLILGLAVFLLGAEVGLMPFGQKLGSALTGQRRPAPMLIAVFAIGFAVTVAEPDILVLSLQVAKVMPDVSPRFMVSMIALGVASFLALGMLRVIFQWPLRYILWIFYLALFILVAFSSPLFLGVSFDSGGATTGPVTVPFIMALGIGVAARIKRKADDDNSFGLVGLASIGPIATMAIMGFTAAPELALGDNPESLAQTAPPSLAAHFIRLLPEQAKHISLALAPLAVLFVFFQLTLLKLSFSQVRQIAFGLVYAFIGLVFFMLGVNGGFTEAGHVLGAKLGALGILPLILVGLFLGAVVVLAEPSVWILCGQTESLSGGHIRGRFLLLALSLSVALAVAVGMLRVSIGFSLWWALLPGYGLALFLLRYCPPLFAGLAFDSGGVASGPMSTTFLLSLTLGASKAMGGNPATDAFGLVALIAMAPLITIQLLGLALDRRMKAGRMRRKTL